MISVMLSHFGWIETTNCIYFALKRIIGKSPYSNRTMMMRSGILLFVKVKKVVRSCSSCFRERNQFAASASKGDKRRQSLSTSSMTFVKKKIVGVACSRNARQIT